MTRPVVVAYVDGFNLYYGALRKTSEKWLDLQRWVEHMLPSYDVRGVVYCTARVTSRPDDPDEHTRQDAYLRALATTPKVRVVEGMFKVQSTRMRRLPEPTCTCCSSAGCLCCAANTLPVLKTEEKGSDVNLAVQLVADGFLGSYDAALVVSNDSDIQPAVDVVRTQLGKRVIVADPRNRKYPALVGDERRRVGRPALVAAQFPEELTDHAGRTIRRPAKWQ